MAKRSQLKLLKDSPKAYGGELLKTRKGRESGWGFKRSSARDMLEVEKWLKSTT